VPQRVSPLAPSHRTSLAPHNSPVACAARCPRLALRFAVPCQPPLGGNNYISTCCNRMFQMYVTYVSSKCCKSRFGVAYVAMAIHVYFKCMFELFQTYVASVLSGCCICCSGYTCMLQVYVSNVSPVLDLCCKCFI
jgi:hypothetical protein